MHDAIKYTNRYIPYCASIKPGEGHLLESLEKHDKEVSGRCKQALGDVGLK